MHVGLFVLRLAGEAARGGGIRGQALVVDALAAVDAHAVGAGGEPPPGVLHVAQLPHVAVDERRVEYGFGARRSERGLRLHDQDRGVGEIKDLGYG